VNSTKESNLLLYSKVLTKLYNILITIFPFTYSLQIVGSVVASSDQGTVLYSIKIAVTFFTFIVFIITRFSKRFKERILPFVIFFLMFYLIAIMGFTVIRESHNMMQHFLMGGALVLCAVVFPNLRWLIPYMIFSLGMVFSTFYFSHGLRYAIGGSVSISMMFLLFFFFFKIRMYVDKEMLSISQEKQKLIVENLKHKSLFNSSSDITLFFNSEHCVTDINSSGLVKLGYEMSFIKGKSLFELPFFDDSAKIFLSRSMATIEEGRQSVVDFKVNFISAFASNHYYDLQLFKVVEEKFSGIACVARDFSKTYEMQLKHEETERLLLSIIQNIPVGVLIIDSGKRIKIVNDAACSITGYSKKDLQGKHCYIFCEHGFKDTCPIDKGCDMEGEESYILHKEGTKIPILRSANIVYINKKRHKLESFFDVSRQKEADRKLTEMVYKDELTGTFNRKAFEEKMSEAFYEEDHREDMKVLVGIDFDNFKFINDSYGHTAGDTVLKEFVSRTRYFLRDSDFLFRIGGDEFALFLDDIKSEMNAVAILDKLRAVNSAKLCLESGQEISYSCSYGAVIYPEHGKDLETLWDKADKALYWSKEKGKSQISFFGGEIYDLYDRDKQVRNLIQSCMDNKFKTVLFQPILRGGDLYKFEALFRFDIENFILDNTELFFKEIEKDKQMVKNIDYWVVEEVVKVLKNLKVPISINVSASHFDLNYYNHIRYLLDFNKVDPSLLFIEITERAVFTNINVVKIVKVFRNAGIRLIIDDFGSKQSDWDRLFELDIDEIKIDKKYIDRLQEGDNKALSIIKAFKVAADGLNISVIAEGVETEGQKKLLSSIGVNNIQGFIFSKPIRREEMSKFI